MRAIRQEGAPHRDVASSRDRTAAPLGSTRRVDPAARPRAGGRVRCRPAPPRARPAPAEGDRRAVARGDPGRGSGGPARPRARPVPGRRPNRTRDEPDRRRLRTFEPGVPEQGDARRRPGDALGVALRPRSRHDQRRPRRRGGDRRDRLRQGALEPARRSLRLPRLLPEPRRRHPPEPLLRRHELHLRRARPDALRLQLRHEQEQPRDAAGDRLGRHPSAHVGACGRRDGEPVPRPLGDKGYLEITGVLADWSAGRDNWFRLTTGNSSSAGRFGGQIPAAAQNVVGTSGLSDVGHFYRLSNGKFRTNLGMVPFPNQGSAVTFDVTLLMPGRGRSPGRSPAPRTPRSTASSPPCGRGTWPPAPRWPGWR